MTTYAIQTQDGWLELVVGEPVRVFDADLDDVITWQYADMLSWSPQFRTARGIKPIVEVDVPDGKIASGSSLGDIDGKPYRVWTLADAPLADRKIAMRAQVNTLRDTKLTGGCVYDFGAAGVHVLQTRDADDKINWLTSQAAYGAAVAGGLGAQPGAQFRSVENATFTVSYAEGLAALLAMAAWGAAIFARSWELKDAIEAAEDAESLDAINIQADWPA